MTGIGTDKGRILVLAPRGRDAAVIGQVLTPSGVSVGNAGDLPALLTAPDAGAGGVVLTEAALYEGEVAVVLDWLDRQPPWSDIPVFHLSTRQAGKRSGRAAALVGSATS